MQEIVNDNMAERDGTGSLIENHCRKRAVSLVQEAAEALDCRIDLWYISINVLEGKRPATLYCLYLAAST